MTNANTSMNRTFTSTIIDSSRELTPLEKVKFKDTNDAVALDMATAEHSITIQPVAWVKVGIHNEKSDDKDYENYVIVSADGTRYKTGSSSFWNAFMDIWADLQELTDNGEVWELKVYQSPSKNYAGRNFLTCAVA